MPYLSAYRDSARMTRAPSQRARYREHRAQITGEDRKPLLTWQHESEHLEHENEYLVHTLWRAGLVGKGRVVEGFACISLYQWDRLLLLFASVQG